MEILVEKYTNEDGQAVSIERFIGNKENCVLTNDTMPISPIVSSISLDAEHGVFLVRDEFCDEYEDGTKGNNIANIYFYIDFDGRTLGMGYTDAFDGMFSVETKYDSENPNNHWFDAYKDFKHLLGLQFGKEIARRKSNYGDRQQRCFVSIKAIKIKKSELMNKWGK